MIEKIDAGTAIRLLDAVLIAGSIACGVVLGWLVIHGLGVAA